jgi:hypothetical protein
MLLVSGEKQRKEKTLSCTLLSRMDAEDRVFTRQAELFREERNTLDRARKGHGGSAPTSNT